MLFFILINFLLFLPFTLIYAQARTSYRRLNFKHQHNESEVIIDIMLSEFNQFIKTIKGYGQLSAGSKLKYLPINFILFIDQVSDVWHNGVLLTINKISLAKPWLAKLLDYQLFWIIICFIFPLATIKNAIRYLCTGCIIKHSFDKRQRHRPHQCKYHGTYQNIVDWLGW